MKLSLSDFDGDIPKAGDRITVKVMSVGKKDVELDPKSLVIMKMEGPMKPDSSIKTAKNSRNFSGAFSAPVKFPKKPMILPTDETVSAERPSEME